MSMHPASPEQGNQPMRSKKTWRAYGFEIVMVGLLVGAIFAFQQRNMLPTDGSITLPDTQFVTLDGHTRSLLAQDKPTLVYIFAPWCSICRISINHVDSLDPDKVHVVKIGVDYQHVDALHQFVAEVGVQGDVLIGNNQTIRDFKVTAYPSIYILSTKGEVVGRSVGYTTSLGLKLRTAFE